MRGDMQPGLHHGGLQNDSSSSSSSPHSNTSHEDILEVSVPDIIPKGFFNFSIPEVIKHEPRIDRDSSRNEAVIQQEILNCRKRKRSFSSNQEPRVRADIIEAPVIVQNNKKQRKARADKQNFPDNDDDCHRQNVPVIDLTGVDSHDERSNALSDSELDTRTDREQPSFYRPYQASAHYNSFPNFERYRNRQFDRFYLRRNPSLQRLQRYQRRNEARQIVTDGPLVTEDMLMTSPDSLLTDAIPTLLPPSVSRSEESVMIVDEVGENHAGNDNSLRTRNDSANSTQYSTRNNHRRRATNPLTHQRMRALRLRQRNEPYDGRHLRMPFHLIPPNNDDDADVGNECRLNYDTTTTNHEQLQATHDSRQRDRRPCGDNTINDTADVINDCGQDVERNDTVTATAERDNLETNSEDDDGEVEFIGVTNLSAAQRRPPVRRSFGRHSPLFPHDVLHYPHSFSSVIGPVISEFSYLPIFQAPHLHQDYLALFSNFPAGINEPDNENYEEFLSLADRIGPAKPRGLEKPDIERLPSFRFSSSTAKETNKKCVVCISEYTNREKLRRLPCSHDFHAKCIDKWLKSNKTCPVCRNEVDPSSAC